MKGLWKPEDKACQDGNVWTCRNVSGPDWCNMHAPGSAFGFRVWILESGIALPTELNHHHSDGTHKDENENHEL